jgi:hypothetical protein
MIALQRGFGRRPTPVACQCVNRSTIDAAGLRGYTRVQIVDVVMHVRYLRIRVHHGCIGEFSAAASPRSRRDGKVALSGVPRWFIESYQVVHPRVCMGDRKGVLERIGNSSPRASHICISGLRPTAITTRWKGGSLECPTVVRRVPQVVHPSVCVEIAKVSSSGSASRLGARPRSASRIASGVHRRIRRRCITGITGQRRSNSREVGQDKGLAP